MSCDHYHVRAARRGYPSKAAKLTPDDVRMIRARYAEGQGLTSLARRFGVTKQSIHNVVRRTYWRHVAP